MAWITPVTNRTSGDARMTAADMDRITGDVAFLQEEYLGSATISKTTWTQDDIITTTFWAELLDAIEDMLDAISATGETMTTDMTFENINAVETNLLLIYGSTDNISDMTAYNESIVGEDEEVYLDDTTFLENGTIAAISAWLD